MNLSYIFTKIKVKSSVTETAVKRLIIKISHSALKSRLKILSKKAIEAMKTISGSKNAKATFEVTGSVLLWPSRR